MVPKRDNEKGRSNEAFNMPASVQTPVFTSMVHRKVQPQTSWQGEGRERRQRDRERERRSRKKGTGIADVKLSALLWEILALFSREQGAAIALVESKGVPQALKALALAMPQSARFWLPHMGFHVVSAV